MPAFLSIPIRQPNETDLDRVCMWHERQGRNYSGHPYVIIQKKEANQSKNPKNFV